MEKYQENYCGVKIMNDNEIKDNLYDLYAAYRHHKQLFDYWKAHHNKNLKTEDEIRDRIKYILKNKLSQKDEISALMWVLGEDKNENTKRD